MYSALAKMLCSIPLFLFTILYVDQKKKKNHNTGPIKFTTSDFNTK